MNIVVDTKLPSSNCRTDLLTNKTFRDELHGLGPGAAVFVDLLLVSPLPLVASLQDSLGASGASCRTPAQKARKGRLQGFGAYLQVPRAVWGMS